MNVVITQRSSSNICGILEYNIRQNDIVIFIDEFKDEIADIDFTQLFKSNKGDKWLYSNRPIHTTHKGNELISREITEKIIKPIINISEIENDRNVLHKGEKQLTPEENTELQMYLEKIKLYQHKEGKIVGDCVMTCNPFTWGHYYLIKYASYQVDYLYVFVVEEDNFFFPFEDRIEMVRKGIKEFDNVTVLPSGKSIISKITFKNYFEKEIFQNVVIDAEKDVLIFKKYVSPVLGISKRFVGEEPDDK